MKVGIVCKSRAGVGGTDDQTDYGIWNMKYEILVGKESQMLGRLTSGGNQVELSIPKKVK